MLWPANMYCLLHREALNRLCLGLLDQCRFLIWKGARGVTERKLGLYFGCDGSISRHLATSFGVEKNGEERSAATRAVTVLTLLKGSVRLEFYSYMLVCLDVVLGAWAYGDW